MKNMAKILLAAVLFNVAFTVASASRNSNFCTSLTTDNKTGSELRQMGQTCSLYANSLAESLKSKIASERLSSKEVFKQLEGVQQALGISNQYYFKASTLGN